MLHNRKYFFELADDDVFTVDGIADYQQVFEIINDVLGERSNDYKE